MKLNNDNVQMGKTMVLYRAEEHKKEMQRQAEEHKKKRAEAEARRARMAAAASVRKAIQKLMGATPENFDSLREELEDVQAQQLDALGDEAQAVIEEVEKGLKQTQDCDIRVPVPKRVQNQQSQSITKHMEPHDPPARFPMIPGCPKHVNNMIQHVNNMLREICCLRFCESFRFYMSLIFAHDILSCFLVV